MKRKILSLMLACTMVFSVCACDTSSDSTPESSGKGETYQFVSVFSNSEEICLNVSISIPVAFCELNISFSTYLTDSLNASDSIV